MQMTNTFEMARYDSELKSRLHHLPVGDPMSGPPYGEMLKSKALGMVLGVVGSIVTMGAAAPLMTSAFLATQIAGGVMMAGGVLSGVGAVTGNKKLAKIGGIMSLAGGVGAAASSLTGGLGLGSGVGTTAGDTMSSFGKSFMESVNSVTGEGGLGIGNVYDTASKAAGVAGEIMPAGSGTPGEAPAAGEFGPLSEADPNATGLLAKASESAPAGQINLADPNAQIGNTFKLGAEGPTQTPVGGEMKLASAESPPINPSDISNQPTPGWNQPGGQSAATADNAGGAVKPPAKEVTPPAADDKLLLGMNKTELLKTGAGLLEKAAAAGMGGDLTQAKINAYAAEVGLHEGQARVYNSQADALQYQLANAKKQVMMISANDPELKAKMAAAAAGGQEVAIIPDVGAGGVKAVNTPFQQAQQMQAQTPVRQGVFARATA
jgi:hypothetical protein